MAKDKTAGERQTTGTERPARPLEADETPASGGQPSGEAGGETMESVRKTIDRYRRAGATIPVCKLRSRLGMRDVGNNKFVAHLLPSFELRFDGVRIGYIGPADDAPICLIRRAEEIELAAIHLRVGPRPDGRLRKVGQPPSARAIKDVQSKLQADQNDEDED